MPKISALPAASSVNLTDILPEVSPAVSGTTYKATFTQVFIAFQTGVSPTWISQVVSNGLTASGSTANDFSGSTGAFNTSSGANTLEGAVTINDATTPSLTTATGKTNTGFVEVLGKTSGGLKITSADSAAETLTLTLAAQTSGNSSLTIKDQAGANKTIAWLESPSFTTPTLGAATATSLTFSPTTGGIVGTTTNDNATAGDVGQYIFSGITTSGSVITLTNNTLTDITSISLTAGDWDVTGQITFQFGAGGSYTTALAWINTTSATPGASYNNLMLSVPATVPGGTISYALPTQRLSLSTTTTVYLSCDLAFTVAAAYGSGFVSARRIR